MSSKRTRSASSCRATGTGMAAPDVEGCTSVAGGGSVTFGAPMVLYSQHPAEMYKQLQDLQKAAHGRKRTHRLQCHNYVNNADAVPRSLGSSLNAVHQAVEGYVAAMSVSKVLLTELSCATKLCSRLHYSA